MYSYHQLVSAIKSCVEDIQTEPEDLELRGIAGIARASVYATVQHIGAALEVADIHLFMLDCGITQEEIDGYKANGGTL